MMEDARLIILEVERRDRELRRVVMVLCEMLLGVSLFTLSHIAARELTNGKATS